MHVYCSIRQTYSGRGRPEYRVYRRATAEARLRLACEIQPPPLRSALSHASERHSARRSLHKINRPTQMPRLHEHVDPAALRRLLRSHLPFSLPAHSALLTPGNPVKVYTTFQATSTADPEGEELVGDEVWVVLIDTGNQFRLYCNAQRKQGPEDRGNTWEAEDLIREVIREVMEQAVRDGREGAPHTLLSLCTLWLTTIAQSSHSREAGCDTGRVDESRRERDGGRMHFGEPDLVRS